MHCSASEHCGIAASVNLCAITASYFTLSCVAFPSVLWNCQDGQISADELQRCLTQSGISGSYQRRINSFYWIYSSHWMQHSPNHLILMFEFYFLICLYVCGHGLDLCVFALHSLLPGDMQTDDQHAGCILHLLDSVILLNVTLWFSFMKCHYQKSVSQLSALISSIPLSNRKHENTISS